MYMDTCLYIYVHVWGHIHVCQAMEIKTANVPVQLWCWFWACELWSLYLYGKSFINWAISPAPIYLYYYNHSLRLSFTFPLVAEYLFNIWACQSQNLLNTNHLNTVFKIILASPSTSKPIKCLPFTSPNRVVTLSYFAPVLSFSMKGKTPLFPLPLYSVALCSELHIPNKRANA